jgi:hypothetical protein
MGQVSMRCIETTLEYLNPENVKLMTYRLDRSGPYAQGDFGLACKKNDSLRLVTNMRKAWKTMSFVLRGTEYVVQHGGVDVRMQLEAYYEEGKGEAFKLINKVLAKGRDARLVTLYGKPLRIPSDAPSSMTMPVNVITNVISVESTGRRATVN